MFSVEAGTPFWPPHMHEPLIITIVFPLSHVLSHRGPWAVRGTPLASTIKHKLTSSFKSWKRGWRDPQQLHELEGYVQGLWETLSEWSRSLLLKFLDKQGWFPQCRNVWCGSCYQKKPSNPFPIKDLLEEEQHLETEDGREQDYRLARNGDHLMGIPFECDLCHFRNVVGRDPVWGQAKDEYTLICIRRANLDTM